MILQIKQAVGVNAVIAARRLGWRAVGKEVVDAEGAQSVWALIV